MSVLKLALILFPRFRRSFSRNFTFSLHSVSSFVFLSFTYLSLFTLFISFPLPFVLLFLCPLSVHICLFIFLYTHLLHFSSSLSFFLLFVLLLSLAETVDMREGRQEPPSSSSKGDLRTHPNAIQEIQG